MKANLFGVAGAALAFLGVVSLAYSATFGFLYSDGRYTTIAPPGSTGSEAFDINDRGQIVGDSGGVTVTPLPPTWMMMMLAGLAGFGLLSYRRKRTLSAAAARFFGFGLGGVAPALTLGNGSRPGGDATSGPAASAVPLRRLAHVARPAGRRGVQDRPPVRKNADEADGDRGALSPSANDEA